MAAGRSQPVPIRPLSLWFERDGLPHYPGLAPRLRQLYGGGIGFRPPVTVANLVASVDGVVDLGPGHPSAGSIISGHDQADRFVMALLRAAADAIVIGARTLRGTPGHLWTAERVCPWAAVELAALRRTLGRPPQPALVVVTRSGDLPIGHRALAGPAVVAVPAPAADRVRRDHPTVEVIDAGAGAGVDLVGLVGQLRARGWSTLLCEGGPLLIGQLLRDGLLDELFLTVAPVLAGRRRGRRRPGLVDGVELLPRQREDLELLAVRQHGSTLLLRYAVTPGERRGVDPLTAPGSRLRRPDSARRGGRSWPGQ